MQKLGKSNEKGRACHGVPYDCTVILEVYYLKVVVSIPIMHENKWTGGYECAVLSIFQTSASKKKKKAPFWCKKQTQR